MALGSGARWATGGHDLVGTQVVLMGTGVSSRGPGPRAVSRKTPEDREDSWFCCLFCFTFLLGFGGWLHRKTKGMRLIRRFGQKYSKKQGAPLLQRLSGVQACLWGPFWGVCPRAQPVSGAGLLASAVLTETHEGASPEAAGTEPSAWVCFQSGSQDSMASVPTHT